MGVRWKAIGERLRKPVRTIAEQEARLGMRTRQSEQDFAAVDSNTGQAAACRIGGVKRAMVSESGERMPTIIAQAGINERFER